MMKIWARMLADLPPTLQCLIARSQRISLPRACPAPERLRRLRAALCRVRTVRATYFAVSPDVQAAVQELRTIRRGLSPADLTARYGPIRPWSQIQAARRPQSISEQLVLLGWLLPRPATPRHPARFLLPPELRAALPRPFAIGTHGPTPATPFPSVLRAAAAILLASAEQPLPIRQNGALRVASLRRLIPRLAPLAPVEAVALCQFVTPLLADLGLLAPHGNGAVLAPAGQRFLGQSSGEQLARLREAWVAAPRPDAWLRAIHHDPRGIVWPLLRRRLLIWAATLPAQQLVDPSATYGALAAALGPLADAQTHGLRRVTRTPWQPAQAARIWEAALIGPLTWLGAIAWATCAERVERCCFATGGVWAAPDHPGGIDLDRGESAWVAGEAGTVAIVHTACMRAVLDLLPYARWLASDMTHTTYQIMPQTLAAAMRRGFGVSRLRALLQRQVGDLPAAWAAFLAASGGQIQIVQTAVVTSADPALLARAMRQRSARRSLTARLAPGVALVDPRRIGSLARTLERAEVPVMIAGDPAVAAPTGLTLAECATLLAVCDGYRQQTPAGALVPQLANIEARLRAALPATLQPTPDDNVEEDQPAAAAAAPEPPLDAIQAPTSADALVSYLPALRQAIRRRRTVQISYTTREERHPTTRIIRPLELEHHGPHWYLHAYCTQARAERCFRLDRISWLLPLMQRRPRGKIRPAEAEPLLPLPPPPLQCGQWFDSALTTSGPAWTTPQPNHPLVRVWLE